MLVSFSTYDRPAQVSVNGKSFEAVVSAKKNLSENRAALAAQEAIETSDETTPPAVAAAFKKWHAGQKEYFYKMYPVQYVSGADTLPGWECRHTSVYTREHNIRFWYPIRSKNEVVRTWRTYDSQFAVWGREVGREVRGEYLDIFVVPYDKPLWVTNGQQNQMTGEPLPAPPYKLGKKISYPRDQWGYDDLHETDGLVSVPTKLLDEA